jgi:hypothetical protein
MSTDRTILDDLKTIRDEIRLHIHLGSKELQDEFTELEKKWEKTVAEADLRKTGEGLAEAARLAGVEIKTGFERIKTAIHNQQDIV